MTRRLRYEMIITSVESAKEADFCIEILIRHWFGVIVLLYKGRSLRFLWTSFGGSVGGGGRYDEMIGKFTGQNTPAVGFSIGFERIVMLLLERGYQVPTAAQKKAFLIDKKMPKEGMLKILNLAKAERALGKQVMIVNMKKNKKFQKEQLMEQGYTEIVDCYADNVEQL